MPFFPDCFHYKFVIGLLLYSLVVDYAWPEFWPGSSPPRSGNMKKKTIYSNNFVVAIVIDGKFNNDDLAVFFLFEF